MSKSLTDVYKNELQKLTKEELIELCMKQSSELGAEYIHQKEMILKRAEAKALKNLLDVFDKVLVVYLDLTTEKAFPKPVQLEQEMNKRFPQKKRWVFERYGKVEPDEKNFYRVYLEVRKFLNLANKLHEAN